MIDRVAVKQAAIDAGDCKADSVAVLCDSCVDRCLYVPDRAVLATKQSPAATPSEKA